MQDKITIHISHSGGCEEHQYPVKEVQCKENHCQFRLYHSNYKQDKCEAYISKTIEKSWKDLNIGPKKGTVIRVYQGDSDTFKENIFNF